MNIAGKTIDTGPEAQAMAQYMHIHALEATSGFTYAQMGQFTAKPGRRSPSGGGQRHQQSRVRPIPRPSSRCRTAPAGQISRPRQPEHELHGLADRVFGIVVEIALLLTGFGFGILVGGALRVRTPSCRSRRSRASRRWRCPWHRTRLHRRTESRREALTHSAALRKGAARSAPGTASGGSAARIASYPPSGRPPGSAP
jgi:hypothetical protein